MKVLNIHALAKSTLSSPLDLVGLEDKRVIIATAIALSESGGNENAVNTANNDGSVDVGLWQINSVHRRDHPFWTVEWLKNPANNAKAMATVSRNGTDWTPWSDYKNGKYKAQLPIVAAALGKKENLMDQFSEGGISDMFDGIGDIFNIGEWFTKAENLQRLAQIVGGVGLGLVAVVIIGNSVAGKVNVLR